MRQGDKREGENLEVTLNLNASRSRKVTRNSRQDTYLSPQDGLRSGRTNESDAAWQNEIAQNSTLIINRSIRTDQNLILLCHIRGATAPSAADGLRESLDSSGQANLRSVTFRQQFRYVSGVCSPSFVFAKQGESFFQIASTHSFLVRSSNLQQTIAGPRSQIDFSFGDNVGSTSYGFSFKRVRQFSPQRKLQFGFELEQADSHRRYRFAEARSGLFIKEEGEFSQRKSEVSGYLTYQFPIGKFGVLPGIRLTSLNLNHDSNSGATTSSLHKNLLLPSLHVDYRLGKGAIARAAYTRKIAPYSDEHFNPGRIRTNYYNTTIGNPELEIGSEQIYELSTEFSSSKSSTIIRIYARERDNPIFSLIKVIDEDKFEIRYVNSISEDRFGLNVNFKRSVTPKLDIAIDLDLFRQRNIWNDGTRQNVGNSTWTTKWNLNWAVDPNDSLLITGQYAGRTAYFGSVRSAELSSSAKYNHNFPGSLTLAVELLDFLASGTETSRYTAPGLIRERETQRRRRALRVTLSKRL